MIQIWYIACLLQFLQENIFTILNNLQGVTFLKVIVCLKTALNFLKINLPVFCVVYRRKLNFANFFVLCVVGMLRQGLPPPPHCLPAMPLPSTRGAASLRQRPIPSRGGQLQVGGVVVGSWGANYGYQANVRQPQLVGYQGRGRGMQPPQSNYNQPQFSRGRGGQQRKQGPPTYNVNKKNNVSAFLFFCYVN